MLQGKKILLAVTGSIAAYKALLLTRLLVKQGAEVKVIMTQAATDFVTPLSFSTLSKNEVHQHLVVDDNWTNHVLLGRWADLMLIAPLTANTLAKMATGLCDHLLEATYLSATCPVAVAPAMDEDMWMHPTVKNNLKIVQEHGVHVLPVEHGELASGLIGPGRMAEPDVIMSWLSGFFNKENKFTGKNILINAGPTYEPIDPVRFIGNRSSGKMGIAIAKAFAEHGAQVTLVLGPTSLKSPAGVLLIPVQTAEEMYTAMIEQSDSADIIVMAAAVADYSPVDVSDQKIKKTGDEMVLNLNETKDILKTVGDRKKANQFLCGFALETENEKENALKKLKTKNLDMIVLNSLRDAGAGFGYDSNKISIFDSNGNEHDYPLKSKEAAANDIVHFIYQEIHA